MTDTQPTKEQIKEFWERYGFRLFNDDDHKIVRQYSAWWIGKWCLPLGKGKYEYFKDGLPPIDLNNLFKYAVPKLIDNYGGILLVLPQRDIKSWECKILNTPRDEATFGYGEDPALALFRALYSVLKEASK